jgi:hypothetical protein
MTVGRTQAVTLAPVALMRPAHLRPPTTPVVIAAELRPAVSRFVGGLADAVFGQFV